MHIVPYILTARVEHQVNVKVFRHSCPMSHGASLNNLIHSNTGALCVL